MKDVMNISTKIIKWIKVSIWCYKNSSQFLRCSYSGLSQTTPWKHSRYCQTGHWGNTTEHTVTAKLPTESKKSRQFVPPTTMCDRHIGPHSLDNHIVCLVFWLSLSSSRNLQLVQNPPATAQHQAGVVGSQLNVLPCAGQNLCQHTCMLLLLFLNPLVSSPLIFLHVSGKCCSRDTQLLPVTDIPKGSWASPVFTWKLVPAHSNSYSPVAWPQFGHKLRRGESMANHFVLWWQSCQGASHSAGSHSSMPVASPDHESSRYLWTLQSPGCRAGCFSTAWTMRCA